MPIGEMRKASTVHQNVERVTFDSGESRRRTRRDTLATEEPLELRLVPASGESGSRHAGHAVAVTMRTPGADFELAAGFLYAEGLIQAASQVAAIRYCLDETVDGAQQYNVVNVFLTPSARFEPASLKRNFYVTSSCGVCGKSSIQAVQELTTGRVVDDLRLPAEAVLGLPDKLEAEQAVFERTGGLHAAGLFTADARLLRVREDVGRHNAMDKLVGASFLAGELPLAGRLLLVSGRLSFELVQKAARAGVPLLAGVSAPSSLAVELAREVGITLVGFLRGRSFNIYAGAERITG